LAIVIGTCGRGATTECTALRAKLICADNWSSLALAAGVRGPSGGCATGADVVRSENKKLNSSAKYIFKRPEPAYTMTENVMNTTKNVVSAEIRIPREAVRRVILGNAPEAGGS
jgi:hypothetical protein